MDISIRKRAVSLVFALILPNLTVLGLADDNIAFSTRQICKAAISVIMGWDVRTLRIYEASSTFVRLSHGDPKSGETYKIKCHVNGDTVIWGNADGRWRTHELDSKITYQASDDILTVVEDYGDGSIKEEHFSREELGH